MFKLQVQRRTLGIRALIAVLVAALFAVLEQMVDVYLASHGLSHADILLDDAIGAALLGIIVFLWVTYVDEHHRRLRAEEKHELTAEMNHHVRNALTVIKYAAYSADQAERVRMTDDAVERIQSTLRELLPALPEQKSEAAAETELPRQRRVI